MSFVGATYDSDITNEPTSQMHYYLTSRLETFLKVPLIQIVDTR
jgi:hypothetical protein